jgi:lipid II:glycine glycyltransferase (peptidoglycan interpeptide bridge formation enzyme)
MYDSLGDKLRLYLAKIDGKIVAGTIAILYGDKVWYLYGASSNEARNYMPNYLLQWEMIKWAVENNCRTYDFRGVSGDIDETNPLYGLYRFKKGYGGDLTEFIGEIALDFKPFIAWCIDNILPIFMWIRKKIMVK